MASGTIVGPLLNGKISGGFAHPSVYNNETLEYPDFDLYGTSSDGLPFVIKQTGVGTTKGTVTRIVGFAFLLFLLCRDFVMFLLLFFFPLPCLCSRFAFSGPFSDMCFLCGRNLPSVAITRIWNMVIFWLALTQTLI